MGSDGDYLSPAALPRLAVHSRLSQSDRKPTEVALELKFLLQTSPLYNHHRRLDFLLQNDVLLPKLLVYRKQLFQFGSLDLCLFKFEYNTVCSGSLNFPQARDFQQSFRHFTHVQESLHALHLLAPLRASQECSNLIRSCLSRPRN